MKCKLRTKRIITRGRKSGFRAVLITQRPQALDTAARNACQVMMAFQCTGHHERTQIEDYVKSNGDPKVMKDMLGTLVSLKVGECWAWAPRDGFLERIQFPRIDVYDSFDAIDENSVNIKTVPVSDKRLASINTALKEFEEQRKANDPELLRKRIRELEAANRKSVAAPAAPAVDKNAAIIARAVGYNEGMKVADDAWRKIATMAVKTIDQTSAKILDTRNLLSADNPALLTLKSTPPRVTVCPPINNVSEGTKSALRNLAIAAAKQLSNKEDSGLSGPEQKVVDAIAWWNALGIKNPSREQICAVAKYSPSSSTIRVVLSVLKRAGLIESTKDGVILSQDGANAANAPESVSHEALRLRIMDILSGPEKKVMEIIINNYPDELTRDDICREANISPDSSTSRVILSVLRRYQFVEKKSAKAASWLFGD